LRQELGLRRYVDLPDFVDELTFAHGGFTFVHTGVWRLFESVRATPKLERLAG
jgi:hypothetical protein